MVDFYVIFREIIFKNKIVELIMRLTDRIDVLHGSLCQSYLRRVIEMIIDCFAGGGGASVGIEMALGRPVDIAINHDPQAILMHKTNHPETLHLTEDIFKVDLQKYVGDRHVDLMWASPDCTSHSKAKGGQPRNNGLRIIVQEPLKTIDTSNRYGMVAAYLTKFYKSGTGQGMFEPIHTITTSPGHFGQVSVLTIKLEDLLKAGVTEETAQKCTWVSEFIIEYYGCGTGQTLNEPLHTIVTKDRFALITILGNEYVILDIYLRMLTAEELKLGQGFPKDYIIDRDYKWRKYPVSEQVKRIGNSVVPIMAKALVEANCGYLKIGERMPNMNLDYTDSQIKFA